MYFSCGSSSTGRYAKLRDMNVIGRTGSTLPLGLFRFDGFERNGTALLQWQVGAAGEVQVFEIERRTPQADFATIGTVQPSSLQSTFHFTDDQLPPGIVYYRLRTLDKAGRSSYSRTVVINRKLAGSYALFPNPAAQTITITHPALAKASEIRIVNTGGQVVSRILAQQSSTQTTVPVQFLYPGSYRALVFAEDSYVVLSFIKQ
jgi:hypothetical protein